MKYWKYWAYTAKGDHVDGVIAGDHPDQLILHLRQTGLQVYNMVTIQPHDYRRLSNYAQRLKRLHNLQQQIGTGQAQPECNLAIPPMTLSTSNERNLGVFARFWWVVIGSIVIGLLRIAVYCVIGQ